MSFQLLIRIKGLIYRLSVVCFHFISIYFPPAKVAPFFLFPNFLYIISKFFIHYLHLSGHRSLISSIFFTGPFHFFPPDHSLSHQTTPFLTTLFPLHHTPSLHPLSPFIPNPPFYSFTLLLLYSFTPLLFYSFTLFLPIYPFFYPFTPILVGNFSLTPTCNDFLLFWW